MVALLRLIRLYGSNITSYVSSPFMSSYVLCIKSFYVLCLRFLMVMILLL